MTTIRWFLLLAAALAPAYSAVPDKIIFNQHVRPVLSDKCFACHGFDAKNRKAGLRLDTPEGATADNDGVRAIVPGDLKKSELWLRINEKDEDEMMPPPESHKKLSDEERAILKKWIEQGAPYQKHWSFEAPVKTAAGSIDKLVTARLMREGLAMSAEADRATLIRRAAFALTGLPPTLAEVDAFLADKSPDAYAKMVERYLASPRFGEEMTRHWLDVARYADTHGLHLDNERQMWAYRDWVVSAFNANKRFDAFTIEQLAGDLLPTPTVEQMVATGYNRCNVTTSEGGSIDAELTFRYAVDRAATMTQTWMGLTAGCAVCHDHKFDPISQKEFYQLYAFFHSNADPAMDGNALLTNPVMKLSRPEDAAKFAEFDARIAATQRQLTDAAAKLAYTDPAAAQPPAAPMQSETVWFEDDFPAGAKVQSTGHPLKLRTKEQGAQVFSGEKSVKRSGAGVIQDFYIEGAAKLVVPRSAEIFVHVFLDGADPTKAVMIQFHKGDWKHRAVWGDYQAIAFGTVNTTERVNAGPLPEKGKWVRLAIAAEKIGLKPGDQLDGFALTQFGGLVFWDKIGVKGLSDPANDPSRSFVAWRKSATGAPADIKNDEAKLRAWYLGNVCVTTKPQLAPLEAQLAAIRKDRAAYDAGIPSTFVFKELAKPRDSFVMLRGAYDKPGEKVEPATPAIFPALSKAGARATRLDLARWLVSPEHPTMARVTVNRFWQQFFGMGLVKTSGDFGSQGEPPSHPELLDWLAVTFRESGWDVKALVRLMVNSAAFRQSARVTPDLLARDPENRWLARGPRLRLDAEQVRDNALFVGALLVSDLGGKGVRPYQPSNIWEPVGFSGSNTRNYTQDKGAALYRRSLYTFLKRTAPPPFMANFDAPNREQFCSRRERSNTPLQALQLMNDTQHIEAARALAQRILVEGGADEAARLTFAFRTVLARNPEAGELAILKQQLAGHRTRYGQDVEAAKKLIVQGESKPKPEFAPVELAAWTLVASTLLNLDETISRN